MNVILYFFILIVELIILIGVSIYGAGLLFSAFKGAPYVPTARKEIEEVLKKANLKKGKRFVEFGSGDGRIVRQAVKKYDVVGVGVEINPLLVWWSRFLAGRDGTAHNVSFLKTNVFAYPLTDVDYLYVFLMPELLVKLMPKFEKEMKKGSLIISHGFKLVGFEKKLIATRPSSAFSTYYYQV
ncbi:MAG: hypothetical protein WAV30_02895 [Microgenomates group bacterium]